jgi:type VI protein secretion system component VasK
MFKSIVNWLLVASTGALALGIYLIWQAVKLGQTQQARALIAPTVAAAVVAAVTWFLFLLRYPPTADDSDGND